MCAKIIVFCSPKWKLKASNTLPPNVYCYCLVGKDHKPQVLWQAAEEIGINLCLVKSPRL